MTAPPFDTLPLERMADRVATRLARRHRTPGYAMLLGSGFSYPLIPTGGQMLRDIPWWLYRQRSPEFAARPFDRKPEVGDERYAGLLAYERELWRAAADEGRGPPLGADGLPDLAAPGAVEKSYTALMGSDSSVGLHDAETRRAYLRDVVRRAGDALNPAYLFLAGILQAQDAADDALRAKWADRRPFCRTVFTTNFDPLLQRALQFVGRLYSVSDRPEFLDRPVDDDSETVQLFYMHGSSHRYLLLNTEHEIERGRRENADRLVPYFEDHGVVVVGYSGWRDATMDALRRCRQYVGNLYWIDIHPPAEAPARLSPEVVDLLAGRRGMAYYVQATAEAAMRALHERLGLGSAPAEVLHPVRHLRTRLGALRLSREEPRPTDASTGGGAMADPTTLAGLWRLQLSRLEAVKEIVDEGPSVAAFAKLYVAKLLADAADADAAGRGADALRLWSRAAETDDAPDDLRGAALLAHGYARQRAGEPSALREALDRALALPGLDAARRAAALHDRGYLRFQAGESEAAAADFDAAIAANGALPTVRASALNSRGLLRTEARDFPHAEADFDAVLADAAATPALRAMALINRGLLRRRLLRYPDAEADLAAAMVAGGDDPQVRSACFVNRALLRQALGRVDEALTDADAALAVPDADADRRVEAHLVRAAILAGARRPGADDEFAAAAAVPGVTERMKIRIDVFRGVGDVEAGRFKPGRDALDAALARLDAGVERDGELASLAVNAAARACLALDEHVRAVALYRRALAAAVPPPSRFHARLGLAAALAGSGETAEAEALLDELQREAPGPGERSGVRLVRAGYAAQRGDAAGETAELEAARAEAPLPGSSALRLATLLRLAGRGNDAADLLAEVRDRSGEPPAVRAAAALERSALLASSNRAQEALADCARVVDADDAPAALRATAHGVRAGLRNDAEDFGGALADAEACLASPEASEPTRLQARYARAVALVALKRREEAAAACGDLAQDDRYGVGARVRFRREQSVQLAEIGRATEAAAALDAALALDGVDAALRADTLRLRAESRRASGAFAEAEADFDAALALTDDAEVRRQTLTGRAAGRAAAGRFEEAAVDFGALIEDPHVAAATRTGLRLRRAETLMAAGRHAAALADWDEALAAKDPTKYRAPISAGRARCLAALDRRTEALAQWEAALADDDAPPTAAAEFRADRAERLAAWGDAAGALADRRAAAADPRGAPDVRADAAREAAAALLLDRDVEGARAALDEALALEGVSPAVRATLFGSRGWTRFEAGDFAGCADDSRTALALAPSLCAVRFNLALALLASGSRAAALDEYRRGAQEATTAAELRDALTDLEALDAKRPRTSGLDEARQTLLARRAAFA